MNLHMKPCSLLVWAMLSCVSQGLQQTQAAWPSPVQPPPPSPIPPTYSSASPPLALPCENTYLQRLSLCIFYIVFNGPAWTNDVGWLECQLLLFLPGYSRQVQTGACNVTINDTQLAPGWAASAASTVTLPDACCWPGVTCCYLEKCRNKLDNPLTCDCKPGLVVSLGLANNNMTGDLNGQYNASGIYDALQWLSCSLRGLQFQNNQLFGSLPKDLTALSELWVLGLGYNNITGTIPAEIGRMSTLRVLELTDNVITGTVPIDLCGDHEARGVSPLTDILIANNNLTGRVDIRKCFNLIMIDAANNQLSGLVSGETFYPQLHVVLMQRNQLLSHRIEIDLSRARLLTEMNLGSNNLNGTLPEALSQEFYMTSLILQHNRLSGTMASSFFDNLGALSNLDLSDNLIQGTLPAGLGRVSSLHRVDVSNNFLTGKLPDSLVPFLSMNTSYLDMRGTYMSCCGSNFTLYPNGTGVYATMNYSLPRLPRGLMFSKTLQPANDYTSPYTVTNNTNLNCPFLKLDPSVEPLLALSGEDWTNQSGLLTTWLLDPSYTLFQDCLCEPGSSLVNDTVLHNVYCIQLPVDAVPDSVTWVWILVGVLVGSLLLAVMLWLLFFRGTRPILVQNIVDMRKRIKGAPQGGLVSIVVTGIEGFSDLMKASAELTGKALLIHNGIMRKAAWSNFGTLVEQVGESSTFVFHEAQDAVRFCLQAQQLLANQAWPHGLLEPRIGRADSSERRRLAGTRRGSKLLKRLRLGSKTNSQSPEHSRQSFLKVSAPAASSAKLQRQPQEEASQQGLVVDTPCPVNGLRVRMGISTGNVPFHSVLSTSPVHELAKFVAFAAAGGQVLMCSSTFQAVRTMGRELGCVDVNGLNYSKLNSTKAKWVLFWRSKEQEQEEATLLHMGQYLYCLQGNSAPVVLTPQLLQPDLPPESYDWRPYNATVPYNAASTTAKQPCSLLEPSLLSSGQSVRLYQVLAPSLVARGRFFGSKLSLREEWVPLDVPYFSAPGALLAPLTSSDFVPSLLSLSMVTMVFCMVDGGKQYASRSRRDAEVVHAELVALMKSVLRQVPGGYFVKGQDGDLKYMVAFADPKWALSWCLAVQECAMYVDWPASALQQWPVERNAATQLLFRGPRLKMGVCEGTPRSILPDYNGRADYLGDSINQAARFMDAAAHGGQVACRADLAVHLLSTAASSVRALATEPASPQEMASWPSGLVLQLPSHAIRGHPASAAWSVGQLTTWHEYEDACIEPAAEGGRAVAAFDAGLLVQQQQQQQQQHDPHGLKQPAALAAAAETATAETAAATAAMAATACTGGAAEPPPPVVASFTPSETAETHLVSSEPTPLHHLSEVVAMHLGSFRFKGSDEAVDMVHVTRASLSGRRFPTDPPKGKGARLSEAKGVLATAHVPLLDIINEYSRRGCLLECPLLTPLPSPAPRLSSLLPGSPAMQHMRRSLSTFWRRSSAGVHLEARSEARSDRQSSGSRHIHSTDT